MSDGKIEVDPETHRSLKRLAESDFQVSDFAERMLDRVKVVRE